MFSQLMRIKSSEFMAISGIFKSFFQAYHCRNNENVDNTRVQIYDPTIPLRPHGGSFCPNDE